MYQHRHSAPSPRIVIIGRSKDTANYERALRRMGACCLTTMDTSCIAGFDGLLLPGGGDIEPSLFGQKNHGSRNIDIELDLLQLQALDLFARWQRPVLGICKGMQVINVCMGGTVLQHIKEAPYHAWEDGDKMHPTTLAPASFLSRIYRKDSMVTNSAHHQAIDRLGQGLHLIQSADDGIPEAIVHTSLPIIGLQWHPERQLGPASPHGLDDGRLVFAYFLSLCSPSGR